MTPFYAAAIAVFVALGILDLILTRKILDAGGHESNPLMAWIMGHGPAHWELAKMAITVAAVVVILRQFGETPLGWFLVCLLVLAWGYVIGNNHAVWRRMRR